MPVHIFIVTNFILTVCVYIARGQSNLKTVLKTVKDKTQKVVLSLNKN